MAFGKKTGLMNFTHTSYHFIGRLFCVFYDYDLLCLYFLKFGYGQGKPIYNSKTPFPTLDLYIGWPQYSLTLTSPQESDVNLTVI